MVEFSLETFLSLETGLRGLSRPLRLLELAGGPAVVADYELQIVFTLFETKSCLVF